MQPMRYLVKWLDEYSNGENYLFALQDLRALLPDLSNTAFKTLLSRTVKSGYLNRLCRDVYLYKRRIQANGLVLFHVAALLRANEFNYISLETALSDGGVISQIPMNWVSIMSSGRSNIVTCGEFGTIEFVYTKQRPSQIMQQLSYDANARLWRAAVPLALRDMKVTRRNCDLIDWNIAHEFIR